MLCHLCGTICTGEVLKVQDKHFHIKCFTCTGELETGPCEWRDVRTYVCAYLRMCVMRIGLVGLASKLFELEISYVTWPHSWCVHTCLLCNQTTFYGCTYISSRQRCVHTYIRICVVSTYVYIVFLSITHICTYVCTYVCMYVSIYTHSVYMLCTYIVFMCITYICTYTLCIEVFYSMCNPLFCYTPATLCTLLHTCYSCTLLHTCYSLYTATHLLLSVHCYTPATLCTLLYTCYFLYTATYLLLLYTATHLLLLYTATHLLLQYTATHLLLLYTTTHLLLLYTATYLLLLYLLHTCYSCTLLHTCYSCTLLHTCYSCTLLHTCYSLYTATHLLFSCTLLHTCYSCTAVVLYLQNVASP